MFVVLTDKNDSEVRVNFEKVLHYKPELAGGTRIYFADDSAGLSVKDSSELIDTILRELYLTVRKRTLP